MRTRILSKLSNFEVEKYLECNDIIFIPVVHRQRCTEDVLWKLNTSDLLEWL